MYTEKKASNREEGIKPAAAAKPQVLSLKHALCTIRYTEPQASPLKYRLRAGTKRPEEAQNSSLESIKHLLGGAVAVPNKGSLCGSIWAAACRLGRVEACPGHCYSRSSAGALGSWLSCRTTEQEVPRATRRQLTTLCVRILAGGQSLPSDSGQRDLWQKE